ncbi:MAG TPA: GNAT family N-acetyltransferase [Polyangia bacterium]
MLRNIGEVAGLADEWKELLGRTATQEIFRSWPWISSWWEVFGREDGREPFVIGVRQGRQLVGLAPLLMRPGRGVGRARLRHLEFMGTGEAEPDEVCSDFQDVYSAQGFEDQVATAVWRRLRDERPHWDVAVFRNILDGSVLSRFVGPMARDAGCAVFRRSSGERFWVDLKARDFNAYTDTLSKKKKKRIFYYRRRLEKEGGFVERRIEDRAEIPFFLAEIARLSRLRLGQKGMESAWQSRKFRRFHAVVAPRLFDQGWLDMRLWTKDGRTVAALYNFLYEGSIHYYQSGFDTAAFGNVSPGLVTISHVIEWGFTHQLKRYDFLIGAEGSYKEDYGCETEVSSDITFYNTTLRGQLGSAAHAVRQTLSDYKARARAEARAAAAAAAGGANGPSVVGERDDDDEQRSG